MYNLTPQKEALTSFLLLSNLVCLVKVVWSHSKLHSYTWENKLLTSSSTPLTQINEILFLIPFFFSHSFFDLWNPLPAQTPWILTQPITLWEKVVLKPTYFFLLPDFALQLWAIHTPLVCCLSPETFRSSSFYPMFSPNLLPVFSHLKENTDVCQRVSSPSETC